MSIVVKYKNENLVFKPLKGYTQRNSLKSIFSMVTLVSGISTVEKVQQEEESFKPF